MQKDTTPNVSVWGCVFTLGVILIAEHETASE